MYQISRKQVTDACIEAVKETERRYASWSGGITMRAAPESFVQTVIAEHLHKLGAALFLEAAVGELMAVSRGDDPDDADPSEPGRVDIAVYYKSRTPRFIIEIKKLSTYHSLDSDHARIVRILKACPKIQNGLMVGYTTAINEATVDKRLNAPSEVLGCKLVRRLDTVTVTGKDGRDRFLGAAVYHVNRPK